MKKICGLLLAICLVLAACGQGGKWQEQYDLGARYLSEGSYEEAIIAFTAAIEIDPKATDAYVGRGDAYMALAADLEQEVLPEETDGLSAMIAALSAGLPEEAVGAYESALADYLAALEQDPAGVRTYISLANLYVALGREEEARAILDQGAGETGDEELQYLASEFPWVVEAPGTGGREVLVYDGEWRILRAVAYLADGQMDRCSWNTYNEAGFLAEQYSWYPTPEEWRSVLERTVFSGDELERIVDFMAYFRDGRWSRQTFRYSGSQVTMGVYDSNGLSQEIPYTMEDAGNHVWIYGTNLSMDGTEVVYVDVQEYTPDGWDFARAAIGPDGSPYTKEW